MSEMRPIDANALNTSVALYMAENAYLNDTPLDILKMVSRWIAEAPTIDAVPVVRCRECKHSDLATTPDGTLYCVAKDEYVRAECFCYDGEKMDGQDANAPTKSDRGCSTCANDGYDMPQCRECTEHPGYPWYQRKDGGAEGCTN